MESKQLEAIVLKRTPVGEKDLVLKVLTREGLQSWWIRGGQKSQKRFLGLLEPSYYIKGLVKRSRGSNYRWYLEEARCLESFSGIRLQYQRVVTAMNLLNFLSRLPEGELPQGEKLFLLLGKSLRFCERGDFEKLPFLTVSFVAYFCYFEGILDPEDPLNQCLKYKLGDWLPKSKSDLPIWLNHIRGLLSQNFHDQLLIE